ncbi:MAG TPA: zf-TFIIB domain-containing protein [Gemmatimonadaceae bacterium]|jgi:hypothetical protein|nr:zf-TFIIB domain-containing protein [Gemmatimonadaceae bacterium]
MTNHTAEHPTRNEDEYFARENAKLVREMRERLDAERQERERQSHFMKCPRCGKDLREEKHEHITIDVCPDCHGAWFDAGELALLHRASRTPFINVVTDLLQLLPHQAPK